MGSKFGMDIETKPVGFVMNILYVWMKFKSRSSTFSASLRWNSILKKTEDKTVFINIHTN